MLVAEFLRRAEGVLAILFEEDEPELPPSPSDDAALDVLSRRARPPEPRERDEAFEEMTKLSPRLS